MLVARVLHNLVADTSDAQFEVLQSARDRLIKGGPERMKFTLPPIVYMALSLVRTIKQEQDSGTAGTVTAEAVRPSAVLTAVLQAKGHSVPTCSSMHCSL